MNILVATLISIQNISQDLFIVAQGVTVIIIY